MGPIGDVDRGFAWHLAHNLPPHAQPTEAGIEQADRRAGLTASRPEQSGG
jgi:hypothetical protein